MIIFINDKEFFTYIVILQISIVLQTNSNRFLKHRRGQKLVMKNDLIQINISNLIDAKGPYSIESEKL